MSSAPFADIIGKPIWGARLGIGTFFYLEFGPREDPPNDAHGRFSLWMQHSSWRISSDDDWIGSDNDRDDAVPWLARLDGQVVKRVECSAFGDLTIEIDGGLLIHTFASFRSQAGDPWSFFKPAEIVVGDARRGTGWRAEPRNE